MQIRVVKCLLRERLQESRMTQVELAARLDMSPQQLNDYVNKRKLMSISTAILVSHILKCNIEDLYEWEIVAE